MTRGKYSTGCLIKKRLFPLDQQINMDGKYRLLKHGYTLACGITFTYKN